MSASSASTPITNASVTSTPLTVIRLVNGVAIPVLDQAGVEVPARHEQPRDQPRDNSSSPIRRRT